MRGLTTWIACMAVLAAHAAPPKPPKVAARNMTVELRVVSPAQLDAANAKGWSVRTASDEETTPVVQKVWVVNGERAQLQLSQAMAVQWVKAVAQQRGSSSTAAGDTQTAEGQLLDQQLVWLEAQQNVLVTVRWPGGRQPAHLDLHIEQASPRTPADSTLPQQHRNQLATRVLVPMGEWTTVGVTGTRSPPPDPHRVSTQLPQDSDARVLQVRVLAP